MMCTYIMVHHLMVRVQSQERVLQQQAVAVEEEVPARSPGRAGSAGGDLEHRDLWG